MIRYSSHKRYTMVLTRSMNKEQYAKCKEWTEKENVKKKMNRNAICDDGFYKL